jgi:MoxR-like ATPase
MTDTIIRPKENEGVLADPTAQDAAIVAAVSDRWPQGAVAFDPSDPEANKRARAAGIVVVGGGDLTKESWANIRRAKALMPAGRSAYKSESKPIFVRTPRQPKVEAVPLTATEAIVAEGDWPTEMQKLIPPKETFKAYVPRQVDGKTDFETVRTAVLNGQTILLTSGAGGGKNHLAAAVAADLGLPLVSISLSGGAQVEDLIGQQLFTGSAHGTVWVDGQFTNFFRHAAAGRRCIVVLDEVNAAPNDVLFRLHSALDERRILGLPEKGQEVLQDTMHNCVVIGTMNPDYRGTKPLNEAFKRRFIVKLKLDYDLTVEKKLLRKAGMENDAVIRLLNLASALRKSYHDTELGQPMGTADLLNYAANIALHGEHIARHSMLQNYDEDEQPAVAEAMRLHLDNAKAIPDNNPF